MLATYRLLKINTPKFRFTQNQVISASIISVPGTLAITWDLAKTRTLKTGPVRLLEDCYLKRWRRLKPPPNGKLPITGNCF